MRNIFLENSYTKSGEETLPPPYSREIWHFQGANTKLIKNAIEKFN